MVTKLTLEQALEVDRVLWEVWDPIGVNEHEAARNEYSGYVSGVVALMESGASARRLWAHLDHIVRGPMGLVPDPERNREIAEVLAEIMRTKKRKP